MSEKIERQAMSQLIATLQRIPDLQVRPNRWVGSGRSDFELVVERAGERCEILALVKPQGHPKQAREAAFQLQRSVKQRENSQIYPIFMAPFISEEAAGVCAEEGIGYLDLSGNGHLAFDGVYLEIRGRPNQFKSNRLLKSLYSPKAERILRVMLGDSIRPWKVQEIADACDVSVGQVSNVRKLLLEREWARTSKGGLELLQPEVILETWRSERPQTRDRREEFFTLERIGAVEEALAETSDRTKIQAALSGLAAATRLAPMSRYKRTWIYTGDLEALAQALNLKRVDSGSNIVLVEPTDEGVFQGIRIVDGIPVVSPVQVFLDLAVGGGRWEEASEELLNQVIEKEWNPQTA